MGKKSNKKSHNQPKKNIEQAEKLQPIQGKCPNCGSSDISLNMDNGKLRCNYCHQEFEPIYADKAIKDIADLSGENISSGASDIDSSSSDLVTIKCQGCGAEITVDTAHSTSARCHWCRSYLSINDTIPNGAVPDMILPFKIKRDEAKQRIEKYVKELRFFAKSRFKRDFTTENIMGVYLPYMTIDANVHTVLDGEGEVNIRNMDKIRDDAQVYSVHREYDLAIEGLTVESASDHLNNRSSEKTNNVVNSIMPFDTENCVKYDSNYLRGFTAEKRDLNVESLKPIATDLIEDISRHAAIPSLSKFNRGVCWKNEVYETKGINWNATYFPVWLYSYMDKNKMLHYVAVNARTGETAGSIPINKVKLLLFSALFEILPVWGFINTMDLFALIIAIVIGPFIYGLFYSMYRNLNARHNHEKETKNKMTNITQTDIKGDIRHGMIDPRIKGENYKRIKVKRHNLLNLFDD